MTLYMVILSALFLWSSPFAAFFTGVYISVKYGDAQKPWPVSLLVGAAAVGLFLNFCLYECPSGYHFTYARSVPNYLVMFSTLGYCGMNFGHLQDSIVAGITHYQTGR